MESEGKELPPLEFKIFKPLRKLRLPATIDDADIDKEETNGFDNDIMDFPSCEGEVIDEADIKPEEKVPEEIIYRREPLPPLDFLPITGMFPFVKLLPVIEDDQISDDNLSFSSLIMDFPDLPPLKKEDEAGSGDENDRKSSHSQDNWINQEKEADLSESYSSSSIHSDFSLSELSKKVKNKARDAPDSDDSLDYLSPIPTSDNDSESSASVEIALLLEAGKGLIGFGDDDDDTSSSVSANTNGYLIKAGLLPVEEKDPKGKRAKGHRPKGPKGKGSKK